MAWGSCLAEGSVNTLLVPSRVADHGTCSRFGTQSFKQQRWMRERHHESSRGGTSANVRKVDVSGYASRNSMRKVGRHESAPGHPQGRKPGAKRSCGGDLCRCVRRRRRAVHDLRHYHSTRPRTTVVSCFSPTISGLDAFISRLYLSGDILRRTEEAWCSLAHNGAGGLSALDRLPVHERQQR